MSQDESVILPRRLDRFVENSLLRRLDPARRRLLHALLAVTIGLGVGLSCWHPELSSLTLLFPCVVFVFFGGPVETGILWVAAFAWLCPRPLEVGAFAAAVAVGSLFARVTADRYRECRGRELELEKAIELARRRQQQLEPPARQVLYGCLEVSTWMQVSRRLGGDFLVVERMDGERVSVVLGDVMGKGLPAALVAAYLEGVYRYLARQGLGPAAILSELNRSLAAFAPEEVLFATAVCLQVDLREGLWTVSRAGHELPSWLELAGPAHLPLGLDSEMRYTQLSVPLRLGDRVLFGSDGATELLGPLTELDLSQGLEPLASRLSGALDDDATLALFQVLACPGPQPLPA